MLNHLTYALVLVSFFILTCPSKVFGQFETEVEECFQGTDVEIEKTKSCTQNTLMWKEHIPDESPFDAPSSSGLFSVGLDTLFHDLYFEGTLFPGNTIPALSKTDKIKLLYCKRSDPILLETFHVWYSEILQNIEKNCLQSVFHDGNQEIPLRVAIINKKIELEKRVLTHLKKMSIKKLWPEVDETSRQHFEDAFVDGYYSKKAAACGDDPVGQPLERFNLIMNSLGKKLHRMSDRMSAKGNAICKVVSSDPDSSCQESDQAIQLKDGETWGRDMKKFFSGKEDSPEKEFYEKCLKTNKKISRKHFAMNVTESGSFCLEEFSHNGIQFKYEEADPYHKIKQGIGDDDSDDGMSGDQECAEKNQITIKSPTYIKLGKDLELKCQIEESPLQQRDLGKVNLANFVKQLNSKAQDRLVSTDVKEKSPLLNRPLLHKLDMLQQIIKDRSRDVSSVGSKTTDETLEFLKEMASQAESNVRLSVFNSVKATLKKDSELDVPIRGKLNDLYNEPDCWVNGANTFLGGETVYLEQNDQAVAALHCRPQHNDVTYIGYVCVRAEYRKYGLGKKLMETAMAFCGNKNPTSKFTLFVEKPNAKALYAKLGFQYIDKSTGTLSTAEDTTSVRRDMILDPSKDGQTLKEVEGRTDEYLQKFFLGGKDADEVASIKDLLANERAIVRSNLDNLVAMKEHLLSTAGAAGDDDSDLHTQAKELRFLQKMILMAEEDNEILRQIKGGHDSFVVPPTIIPIIPKTVPKPPVIDLGAPQLLVSSLSQNLSRQWDPAHKKDKTQKDDVLEKIINGHQYKQHAISPHHNYCWARSMMVCVLGEVLDGSVGKFEHFLAKIQSFAKEDQFSKAEKDSFVLFLRSLKAEPSWEKRLTMLNHENVDNLVTKFVLAVSGAQKYRPGGAAQINNFLAYLNHNLGKEKNRIRIYNLESVAKSGPNKTPVTVMGKKDDDRGALKVNDFLSVDPRPKFFMYPDPEADHFHILIDQRIFVP